MNGTFDIRISFTPAAHAVWRGQRVSRQQHHQHAAHMQVGDHVEFPGNEAGFVVIGRHWTISPESEALMILIDLFPDVAPLRVVP